MAGRRSRRSGCGALIVTTVCALAGAPASGLAVVALPPGLTALEQKMQALKVTSLRFSVKTSIKLPRSDQGLKCLLKFFGSGSETSGELTTAPAAANISFELFGSKWTVRSVGGSVYAYFPQLSRFDHGRPWVKLGKGGLAEIFTVNGHRVRTPKPEPPPAEPKLAEPPFAGLQKLLAGAREVRELGPETVDGQSTTRFLAVLEPAQLKAKPLASTARVKPPPPVEAPAATLEVSIAASGLPVRTVIVVHAARTTTTTMLDIPEINFPLVINPPSAAKIISPRGVRQLEKHALKHARRTKKPRNPFASCERLKTG